MTRVVTLSLKPLVVEEQTLPLAARPFRQPSLSLLRTSLQVENFLDGGENGVSVERATPNQRTSLAD